MWMTRERFNLRKLCNFFIVWIILNIGILIELCRGEWKESLVHTGYKMSMQTSNKNYEYGFLYRLRCQNMRRYSRSELHKWRGKYSLKRLKEDVCKVIKNYGIKRKFRVTKGRKIRSRKRNWDNNMGVHTSLLKQLKKVPTSYDNKNSLGLAICNARLLYKKTRDLISDCSLNKIDVCFIVESWVNGEVDVIELSVLKDFGYKINVAERKNRSGGGVSLIYRSNIEDSCGEKGEYESFEHALWRMQLGNQQLIVLGVYRPPYSTAHLVDSF